MNKFIVTLILALPTAISVFSQRPFITVESVQTWKNQAVDDPNFQFLKSPYIITGFELDSTNQIMYFKLRNDGKDSRKLPGYLVAFDFENKAILWDFPFNPEKDLLFLIDTLPVTRIGWNVRAHDRNNGKELWTTQAEMETVVPDKMLGLGLYTQPSKYIVGIDLTSGKLKWTYEANNMSNLETITFFGDTAMVITANGIHYVNLDSGVGFSHKATTEYYEGNSSMYVAGGMLGGLLGALIFTAIDKSVSPVSHNMVGNKQKPYTLHGGSIFFTSTKDIMAFDTTGDLLWKIRLPKGLIGLSKMFIINDALYVINNGVLHTPDGSVYGEIWLSKWDMESGTVLHSKMIGTQKEQFIKDFIVKEATIVIALNNGMAEYTLEDFTLVKEKKYGSPTHVSGLKNIIADNAYIKVNGNLENNETVFPDYVYIENTIGMKIGFTPDFDLKTVVKKLDFYTVKNALGSFLLLDNGSEALLIDSSGKLVSRISLTSNAKIVNNVLIDFNENSMMIAPLKGF